MSEVIFIQDVRLSFPKLKDPQIMKNEFTGKETVKYNCELLMSTDHKGYKDFMLRVTELATEKWKENAQNALNTIIPDRKSRCFGKGEEKVNKKTFQPYDGYSDMVYISASKDTPPQMIRANGTSVEPGNTMEYQQLAGKLYGGCRVNVALKPWIQDNQFGRAVRCELAAIQFFKDDAPFGEGNTDYSAVFSPVQEVKASPAPAESMGLPPFMTVHSDD